MKKLRWLIVCVVLSCISSLAVHAEPPLRILWVGNSFTYFDSAHVKLQAIAEGEGRAVEINAQLQGGYSFQRHLYRDQTMSAIMYYVYDVAILQDQSRHLALYAQAPERCALISKDAQELTDRIHIYSPNAQIYLEQTWAFEDGDFGGFGSWETFDKLLQEGTAMVARNIGAKVDPIGEAFRICRETHPEIELYTPDRKHPSAYGAYMKACVTYIAIFGRPIMNATNCGLDSTKCAILRGIANTKLAKPAKPAKQ